MEVKEEELPQPGIIEEVKPEVVQNLEQVELDHEKPKEIERSNEAT